MNLFDKNGGRGNKNNKKSPTVEASPAFSEKKSPAPQTGFK